MQRIACMILCGVISNPIINQSHIMKAPKTFTIASTRNGKPSFQKTGTLAELIQCFSYTLETGASYQHEKGNKKINRNPSNAAALVKNLNNATNNAAANGYSSTRYDLVEEAAAVAAA